MRFREVERKIEKETIHKEEHHAFEQIKPETDITMEECQNFWDDLFSKEIQE